MQGKATMEAKETKGHAIGLWREFVSGDTPDGVRCLTQCAYFMPHQQMHADVLQLVDKGSLLTQRVVQASRCYVGAKSLMQSASS